ncbi:MAG: hypothetical protein IH825_07425, partial [Candidatus Marinimicrobia bacterium]|nr:hypothetical protein [Candidatus Neomarinimicrobiota bacterium]
AQSITGVISTAYIYSVFAKADQLDWLYLQVGNIASQVINASFDLTNGVVGATTGADNTSEFIEDFGNGWFRCGIGFTTDGADASGTFRIRVAEADNDFNVDLDGTSSIFVWGAQLEAGAFPTSYIPTGASAVTRNADDIQTSSIGTQWNDNASTVYVDVSVPALAGATKDILDFTDGGAGADRVELLLNNPDEARIVTVSSGGAAGDADIATTDSPFASPFNVSHKIAITVADSDSELYVDGIRTGTGDQTVDVPTGIDTLHVGQNFLEANTLVCHIIGIRYYGLNGAAQFLEDLTNGIA